MNNTTLSHDNNETTTTIDFEQFWNGTDSLNGTASLVVHESTRKIISIIVPLICIVIIAIILVILFAKKYKKKAKLKCHIESQISYNLDDELVFGDKTKGDIERPFSGSDEIEVVAETLHNRRQYTTETETYSSVVKNDKTELTAEMFSGNGKGLSGDRKGETCDRKWKWIKVLAQACAGR